MSEVSGKWHPENAAAVIELLTRLKEQGKEPTFKLTYYGRSTNEVHFVVTVADGEPKTVFLAGSMRAGGGAKA